MEVVKFMKKYRKQIKLGVICLVIILFIALVWLFVLPSFNGNKYGDRLREEKKYKMPIVKTKTTTVKIANFAFLFTTTHLHFHNLCFHYSYFYNQLLDNLQYHL